LVCDSGGQRIEVTGGAVKINNAYTMPAADGTAGQVVCTNGSDTLTFGPGGYWTCAAGPELYYTGGNVGIGTADPSHTLDVEGVANFLTCTVTPDVCATTKVIGAIVCSAGVLCTATHLCTGGDVHAANCILAGKCICSTTCVRAAVCVGTAHVCGSTQVTGTTLCASSALTVAAGTVAGAPSGTNDITSKCYVDAQITANAKGACCGAAFYMTLPAGGQTSSTVGVTAPAYAGGNTITHYSMYYKLYNAPWNMCQIIDGCYGQIDFTISLKCGGCCVCAATIEQMPTLSNECVGANCIVGGIAYFYA
jgi:hypothetical protein